MPAAIFSIFPFIRDFRVVKGDDGSYINISKNRTVNEKVKELTGMTNLDALFLTEKEVGREKRIPFEVSVDPFYSESNIRYLEQKMADYKAGRR